MSYFVSEYRMMSSIFFDKYSIRSGVLSSKESNGCFFCCIPNGHTYLDFFRLRSSSNTSIIPSATIQKPLDL